MPESEHKTGNKKGYANWHLTLAFYFTYDANDWKENKD